MAPQTGREGLKGGLKADARARVLDGAGQPIPKLYAAGNNSANPFGDCYPGAGATIGPAMTFGFLIGEQLVDQANPQDQGETQVDR